MKLTASQQTPLGLGQTPKPTPGQDQGAGDKQNGNDGELDPEEWERRESWKLQKQRTEENKVSQQVQDGQQVFHDRRQTENIISASAEMQQVAQRLNTEM